MAGYTRQSLASIINGANITAPPLNAEFNTLADAFGASGHSHDGSAGNAPQIDLTTSVTGILPQENGGLGGKSKFDATTAPSASDDIDQGYTVGSLWENVTNGRIYVCVGNASYAAVWRELITVWDGDKIVPDGAIDLGTATDKFGDAWLSGFLAVASNATIGGTLNVTGATGLSSLNVSGIGTIATLSATTADVSSSLSTYDLTVTNGASLNSVTISGGNIDATVIGATNPTAGTFTSVTSNTASLTSADIDGGSIDGTPIGSTTPNSGAFTSVTTPSLTATTADINGGTIDGSNIGSNSPSTITGTTITANTGFVGDITGNVTGNVSGDITGNITGDVTGDLTGNVTATTGTSTFNDVTIDGTLNMNAGTVATIENLSAPVNPNDAARKVDVDNAVAGLLDSAPEALNTLNELAAALNDDADAFNTLNTAISARLPLAGGTMTGDIDLGANAITTSADPVSAGDLSRKGYVDTQDALKVNKSGDTMSGGLDMGANQVSTTANPTTDDHLARKGYVDAIYTNLTEASISAAAAATSAGEALASEQAAATSESNASTSEANAATSAAASATSAASSATARDASIAARDASITARDASQAAQTAAETAETNAETAETNAANSATASASSAAASETSRIASETARAAAEAVYDDFDDRYLGPKATAPNTDNDGETLAVGSLYFNTTGGYMYVWDGAAWIGVSPELINDTSPQLGGNLDPNGFTIDGRDVSVDGAKLDGIETGATADQTGAEIKALYEAEADTNAFTDADHTKLDGIEAGAQVNVGSNIGLTRTDVAVYINSSTGTGKWLTAATDTASGVMTAADRTKLDGIEAGATADQTITAGTGLTGGGTGDVTLNVDTTTIATQNYVDTAVSNLVDSAPATLDTLNELAAALGDDPDFATTIATSIGTKLNADHDMTLTLSGDVTGSATFTDMGDATLDVAINADDIIVDDKTIKSHDSLDYVTVWESTEGAAYNSGRTIIELNAPSGGTNSNLESTLTLRNGNELVDYFHQSEGGTQDKFGVAYLRGTVTDTWKPWIFQCQDLWDSSGPDGFRERVRIDTPSGNVAIGDVGQANLASVTANLQVRDYSPTILLDGLGDGQYTGGTLKFMNGATANNFGVHFGTQVANAEGTGSTFVINETDSNGDYNASILTYNHGTGADTGSLYIARGVVFGNWTSFDMGASVTGNITVTGTVDGRDVAVDGAKLDGIEASANNYSLPTASGSALGGVKTGYTQNAKNYPVQLDGSDKMYVNVPWDDDTNTWRPIHDTPVNGATTTSISSNWAFDNVKTPVPSGAVFTDNNTTYSAGNGLDLSGTTFSHSDTSSQASVSNTGRTYIQDITLDTYGHITGITSATETVVNTNTNKLTTFQVEDGDGTEVTISHGKEWKFVEGNDIDVNWTDTSTGSDGDPFDLTIAHKNTTRTNTTSTATPAYGGTFTAVDSVTTNARGHVTGVNTKTVTIPASDNTDTWRPIHDTPVDGATTTSISSNWAFDNVKTPVPAGAVFTDNNTTYSAGSGISLSGTTFSHSDTSSQASVNNSGSTVIQDVTLDTYGHVTGLTSTTLSLSADFTWSSAKDVGNTVTGMSGAREIVIVMKNLNASGPTGLGLRLGDSGGIESNSSYQNIYYIGQSPSITGAMSTFFVLNSTNTYQSTNSGVAHLYSHDGVNWWCSGIGFSSGSGYNGHVMTGWKTLSSTLDRAQLFATSGAGHYSGDWYVGWR